MRRIVVVLLLLGGMLGLELLKAEPVSVGDPLTLAAIGFVVLAAFTIAEVGQALTLPRVSGFILAGIALGPYASNILSQAVVAEMRMFNTLALGLIATTAGLELDVKSLRSVWRTLLSTVGMKLLLVLPLVGGGFYALETGFGFLGLSGPAIAAVALLVGTFALGTSPSVTLAVLSETRAKGRLSDLILGAAVVKDLVVVVILAVTVAIARSLVSPGASLDASVFVHVGRELGSTVVVGAALGVLLIAYIRFIRAEMLLFVAAMILVAAELSEALHLELLLVFIVAGFVVRNFSSFEHELHAPLQMVSLPVFVVFFTIAGASVNLQTLLGLLPLALTLSAVRAGAFWIAARVGGAAGAETRVVRQTAWLGYLPLAGVTLGLVGLAALRIPELATPIASLGMAFIAVNLLIGPIALKSALGRAGEIPEAPVTQAKPRPSAPPSSPDTKARNIEVELTTARELLDSPELVDAFDRVYQDLSETLERFATESIDPWTEALREAGVHSVVEGKRRLEALRDFAEGNAGDEAAELRLARIEGLFQDLQGRLRSLPTVVSAPLSRGAHRIASGDDWSTRWRKRSLRVVRLVTLGRARGAREVPVRMLARLALEPRLARLGLDALGALGRTQGRVTEELRRFAADDVDAAEARDTIESELGTWRDRFVSDARHALVRGLGRFAVLAAQAGGPDLPARQIRYSSVEPEVRAALQGLRAAAVGWADAVVAARQTLLLWIHLAAIDTALRRAFDEDVMRPLQEACGASAPGIERVRQQLDTVNQRLPKEPTTLSKADLEALQRICRNALPASVQSELRLARARFARTTAARDLALELRALVGSLPEKLVVLRPGAAVHTAATSQDVAVRTVNLRVIAEQKLLSELLPTVDSALADVSQRIATVSSRVREAIDVAAHTLEPGPDGDVTEPEFLSRGLERALERLELVRADLEAVRTTAVEELAARVRTIQAELASLALSEASTELRIAQVDSVLGTMIRGATERLRPIRQRAVALRRRLMAEFRRFQSGELSRDIQIRYARTALDAGAIRSYLSNWSDTSHVPQPYLRLFTLEPLRDRRFFVANRTELASIIAAERQWIDGGPGSALIVGRHGSGMSTLLNLCQVELRTQRIFRPDWALAQRKHGLIPLLADDLGCDPNEPSVLAALSVQRTVVLVDDLQSWVAPDSAGLTGLERLLELIVASRARVFWVVSVEQDALSLMEEAFGVRQAFGRIVQINPAPLETLMSMIETRHRLSGFQLDYPSTVASRLLSRFRRTSEREVFFRVLAGATDGNLRLSLVAWRRAIRQLDGAAAVPSLQSVLAVGLPFVPMLPPRAVAMLVQLLRFGPLDVQWLSRSAGLETGEADRNLGFLENAGLLEPIEPGRLERRIPIAVQEAVSRGLREMGAIRARAPR